MKISARTDKALSKKAKSKSAGEALLHRFPPGDVFIPKGIAAGDSFQPRSGTIAGIMAVFSLPTIA